MHAITALLSLLLALPPPAVAQMEEGIPVTDSVVLAKCGSCHTADDHGNMQRLSWERSTPEGWEEALKRMIRTRQVVLTPTEARGIVRYLSGTHGMAPEEAKPILYEAERRIHDENGMADENLMNTCAKCHDIARALAWRRSLDDWKEFTKAHVAKFKFKPNEEAILSLNKLTPLHSSDWQAWESHSPKAALTGRWLVTAHVPGRGKFYGEMNVEPGSAEGEFLTRVSLKSVSDGTTVTRVGRNVVYSGFEWRGRSKGVAPSSSDPDDLSSEARETMWVSPDGSTAQGRWFWGQYQEFGFDVKMRKDSGGAALLTLDVSSLKIGSRGSRVRFIGDRLPTRITGSDINAGAGIIVRRIISNNASEVVAEVDVSADTPAGRRDVSFQSQTLSGALAIYDRVDYVKVTPESSLAAFGSPEYIRGFQHFEAIGYQRGPDERLHTADDLELGPVDVAWSMEVFYETDAGKNALVGNVSQTGFFTPAATNPGSNYDIWVIATAKDDLGKEGKPLIGKGYVVVTVPTYTFEGRKYVRELDRWVEDGRETR